MGIKMTQEKVCEDDRRMDCTKKKILYYELLRIIAICCIIFNHTGDNAFFLFSVTDSPIEYVLSMMLAILCKVGVPIFFMISGALLIPKEEDLKTLITKRILRIAIVIVLFSFVLYVRQYIYHPEYGFGLFFFFKTIYSSEFVIPYWFLYSYMALLIVLPFIRKMAQNMSKTEYMYLVVLGVIFNCLCPIFDYFLGANIHIGLFISSSNILFSLLGYGMEHVLEESDYTKHGNLFMGMITFASVMISGLLIYVEYKCSGAYSERFVGIFVLVQTLALFYCVKYQSIKCIRSCPRWLQKCILGVGGCTFGIYLLEEILRTDLDGMFQYLCPPVPLLLVCIVYILAVMGIGTLVVLILKHVPGIRRLL